MNPVASIEDIQRHVRGEPEVFPCVGGHKYFYLDWNLDIWRCEAWSEPLGSVFEFDRIPEQRDHCTACMMSCYHDTSVLMHAGIALGDGAAALIAGRFREAAGLLFRHSVAASLRSAAEEMPRVARLAWRRAARNRLSKKVPISATLEQPFRPDRANQTPAAPFGPPCATKNNEAILAAQDVVGARDGLRPPAPHTRPPPWFRRRRCGAPCRPRPASPPVPRRWSSCGPVETARRLPTARSAW
jgi:hypothetical protein